MPHLVTPGTFRGRMPRSGQGFTLMEVLIAVSITAIIGLGIWQVLSGVTTARERVDEVASEFEGMQQAFLLLERDLRQFVNRPVRNIYGDYEPALTSRMSDFELVITRQGWRNPLGSRRSNLQRSAWEYTGEELRRRYWIMVDQGQEDQSRDQLLLEGVEEFTTRFLDHNENWHEEWPPDNLGTPTGTSNTTPLLPAPAAVEVTLVHLRFGEIRRLFLMPDFDIMTVQDALNRQSEQDESDEEDEEGGEDVPPESDSDSAPEDD